MRRALHLLLVLSAYLCAEYFQAQETKQKSLLSRIFEPDAAHHDAEAMGNCWTDDFVFTDTDGTVMSKPQFLESIRDKSYQLSVEHQIT